MSQQPMNVNSANQFIGSRISLISKADIRYGGILYSLDLQEATISLAKVRSYGTEDRPTERPIPVKDEIYEFIIFRGADIKSIDVVEPPKSGSTLSCGLPQDPAIIEVSHFQGGSSMNGGRGHHCGMDGSSSHSQGGGGGGMRYTSNRGGGGSEGLFEGLLRGGRSNGGGGRGHQGGRRTSNDAGTQSERRNGGGRNNNARNVDNGGRRSRQDNNYVRGSSGGNNGSRSGRGNTPNRSNRGGGGQGRDDRDPQHRGGQGQSRNRSQNRQRGIIQAQMPPKVTFEDPFDFEKSNEELKTAMEKLKLSDEEKNKEAGGDGDEALEKEKEEPMIYYDKDKFFDNISCEALERTKGKPPRQDWRAERKLNAETFGLNWNANQMRNGPRSFRPRNNDRDRDNGGGYRGNNGGGGNGNQIRYNNYNNRYNNRNSYGNGNNRQQQQRND